MISKRTAGCSLADLVVISVVIFLLICILCSGCPLPLPPAPVPPTPTADASVADPFRDGIFDCRLPAVAARYAESRSKVRDCLDSPPLDCLSGLAGTYGTDTVACMVRDIGFTENNAVLFGNSPDGGADRANLVRDFINSRNIGFK